ncbi:MAG TPA: DUF6178 family protein [Malonomonas sp.]
MTRIQLPTERQIGHLTLHRQGRKLSLKEYNALSRSERLEMIHQASGKQKYDLILNANDNEQLVPLLHPQELYLTVNELGAEYAVELLTLASTEQITTLLDLDCWNGDSLSPVLTLHWLQLLLETGQEKVCQLAQEIEPEILAIFLQKHLTIIRGLEAYDDDDAENAKRMESIYDVDYATEDAAKVIGPFLQIIVERVQETYMRVMEMIRSEMLSTFEEEMFQERNNRLSDLGFVTKVEARGIYAFTDPKQFKPGGKSDYRIEAEGLPYPGALLAKANPDNLLAEILSNGLNHQLATELCMLANRKMSADGTDTSAAAEITSSLQQLYDTLNLALEYLAGTDLQKAEQIVDSTYLLHLFQLGHSLQKQLVTAAQKIAASPIGAFLDYPEQLFIDSLLDNPAMLYHEATTEMPSHLQPIATLNDLNLTRVRLQQVQALQQLFCQQLPFSLPEQSDPPEESPSLSALFLTAVANQLLGRSFQPTPLQAEDLLLLQSKTLTAGEIAPEFKSALHRQVEQLDLDCGFFIEFCLECWEDDFLNLDIDNLQTNSPAGLLLAD